MKNSAHKILLFLLPALSLAQGATIPSIEITVTNAAGKVAYKGMTTANGTFATGNLEPGNYVVEFDSKTKIDKGAKFALNAAAGKNNVSSDSVAGEKFVNPGVAMRVTVAGNTKITGQVAPAGTEAKQTVASGSSKAKVRAPVKIINGKRYVWVRPQTSTLSGGHWVEEGSPEAMEAEGATKVLGSPPAQRSGGMRY